MRACLDCSLAALLFFLELCSATLTAFLLLLGMKTLALTGNNPVFFNKINGDEEMKNFLQKMYGRTTSYVRDRKKVIAVAVAAALALPAANAFALTWPPTAADIAALFTGVITTIGEVVAAIAVAAAGLYAGVIAVKAGFEWFGKFYKSTKAAA